jgi:hypothetical protein
MSVMFYMSRRGLTFRPRKPLKVHRERSSSNSSNESRNQLNCRPILVSSESEKKSDAITLLRNREVKVASGVPMVADIGRLTFEQARDDLLADYTVNRKRSLRTLKIRLTKHLDPFFRGRRLTAISMPLVRQFVLTRQNDSTCV